MIQQTTPSSGTCRFCPSKRPPGYSVTCGKSECQEAAYNEAVAKRKVKRVRKPRKLQS